MERGHRKGSTMCGDWACGPIWPPAGVSTSRRLMFQKAESCLFGTLPRSLLGSLPMPMKSQVAWPSGSSTEAALSLNTGNLKAAETPTLVVSQAVQGYCSLLKRAEEAHAKRMFKVLSATAEAVTSMSIVQKVQTGKSRKPRLRSS